ncbi:hypothetical protein HYDPIDRAFT_113957 [Hydnomerulius pinastri MD-312]|uniref:Unplaced genomic scaffold scaffold_19, whole genome shotgun sequence n=1 Tax=Hydnomerulius pinastri MD-312 TaxID=994086 RepID=A0A0C9WDX5_9AGAM|nr:hypothetical protein HYDPIDRAFT_113957 [Hydnomerulius pinastri MD-312]
MTVTLRYAAHLLSWISQRPFSSYPCQTCVFSRSCSPVQARSHDRQSVQLDAIRSGVACGHRPIPTAPLGGGPVDGTFGGVLATVFICMASGGWNAVPRRVRISPGRQCRQLYLLPSVTSGGVLLNQ